MRHAEAMRRRAHEAYLRGDVNEALAGLRKAVKASPDDPASLTALAKLLLRTGRVHSCEPHLRKLLRVRPRSAATWMAVGEMFERARNPAEAERCYARAAELEREPATPLARRAVVAERLHKLEEAREAVERALDAAPGHAEALYARGLLLARDRDEAGAGEVFRRVLGSDARPEVRVAAGYHLAQALDRQGRYDEAMEALTRVKAEQARDHGEAIRRARATNEARDALIEQIGPGHLAPADRSAGARPVAALIGFPRTGTTLLERSLDAHPRIVSAEETPALDLGVISPLLRGRAETEVTADVLRETGPRDAADRRRTYLELIQEYIREPLGSRLLLDKNPSQTVLVPFLKRIFARLKLIVALRDPRDVVISAYMMPWSGIGDFTANLLDLRTTAEHYARLTGAWLRYRELLGGDYIEVRYEDTVEDLSGRVREVLDFLGQPWDDAVLGYRRRTTRRPGHSPTYADVRRPVYRRALGRWRHYERHLEPVLPTLDPFIRELGYG